MKLLFILFFCITSLVANAQQPDAGLPADAPLIVSVTPADTVCVSTEERLLEGKGAKRCADEMADIKKGNAIIPTALAITIPSVLVVVIAALVVAYVKKP
jgi:hypothetical protein